MQAVNKEELEGRICEVDENSLLPDHLLVLYRCQMCCENKQYSSRQWQQEHTRERVSSM
jgi:hypothetical protein